MGKKIAKKIRGFSWKAKISLVLSFTVLFSVFMYQGWYKPKVTLADTYTATASGSWQAPTSQTITVECWGGGGGGGAGNNTNNIGGGGGGGGEYRKGSVSVISGNTYNFTVGAGGTGTNVNGGAGAQTTFNSTSVVAKGGSGGLAANGGGGAGGTGGTGAAANFNGGNGAAGNGINSGGGGGAAGTTSIGGNASGTTAGAAGSGDGTAGAGGAGVTTNATAGGNGNVYGGGGAGSTGKTVAGANGAGGYIRITFAPAADTTPPQVSSVAVQTGLTVNIVFNEAMGTGVTTASNYTVSGTGKGSLANNPNSVALVSGNTYRLTWSAGEMINGGNITITAANAKDAAGNTIGSPSNATHTGGAIGVLPTVSSTTPTNGATGVSPNTSLMVVFSENIDCAAAASGNITMAGATIGSPVCSAPTNTITYPVSAQSGSTTYNYTVGGVKDVAGNTMVTTASRSYTTSAVDSTPPTVSSTTPANGATGIAVNTSLVVLLSENIDCATAAAGNITMAGATVGAPSCSAPTTTITYPISGQAGGTLYTYSIGGVKDVAGNTMTTTANRTYTTAAAAETPNAVSATSATVASAATDTQANVVMQRMTINSDTVSGSNNQVVLSTLTLDDAGNATAIAAVKVYISSTSSATLPANAVLLGGKSKWNGSSTVLGLVGGTTADRTVTAGTAKYLYIVYDMAFDQQTKTVQVHVSNLGVSSPDTSAAVNLSSSLITLTDGVNVAVVTACTSCHAMPPVDASGTARNTPATAVVGSHLKHGNICSNCHVAPASQTSADFDHRNGNIEFIGGVGYTKGTSFAQTNPTDGTGLGTCNTATCHNAYGATGVATPKWGVAATCASCHAASPTTGNHTLHMALGGAACNQCHNGAVAGSTGGTAHLDYDIDVTGGYPANVARHIAGSGYSSCSNASCHKDPYSSGFAATPTWGSTGSGCSACHLAFPISASGPATGAHVAHAGRACMACHNAGTTATAAPTTAHNDGDIDIIASGYPANITRHTAGTYTGTCSTNIYCHSTGQSTTGGATPVYKTSPVWSGTTNCGSCHLNFDNDASGTGDHVKHAQGTANFACATCHNGYTETTVATATHVNNTIELGFSGTYGTGTVYSQGNGAVGLGYGNCTASKCHGSGAPVWGGALHNASVICENCHGSAATSPFYSTAAPTKMTAETDSKVGAHLAHLTARAGYTNPVTCGECHVVPATITSGTHMSGSATPVFSGDAVLNGASPTYVTSTCNNTYCHGAKMIGGSNNGTDTSPTWTQTTLITGTPSKTGDCAACHGCPPNTASHGTEALSACIGCHDHVNADGSFTSGANRGKHMDGIVQASGGDCLGCHSTLVAADFVRPSRHVSNGTATSIVTNFDCIVCHSEGDANSSGTTINRTTLHSGNSSGPVDLRNVDSAVTGAGTVNTNYWAWPGRRGTPLAKGSANTLSRDRMDSFCMGCHDANGSSTIAVNNANNGLIVGAAAVSTIRAVTGTGNTNTNNANLAQRPFNTNDKLQNTRDTALAGNGTTHGTFRLTTYGRVLNVKSQFNSGNAAGISWASHHNLNQFVKRYTSNNTTVGTGLPTTVWTAYVNKEGYTLNGTGAGTGANAGLHCSDCHLNEVNAHGSVSSWYMLNGKDIANDTDVTPTTSGTSTTTTETSCFRCHAAAQYAEGGGGTAGRVDHSGRCNNIDVVTGTAVEAPFGNNCHACHGGFGDTAQTVNQDVVGNGSTLRGRGALGAIHGNNETYTPGGGSATKRYRFMSGASMRFWNPSQAATTDWANVASSAGTCYTLTAADQWGSCTKHGGGTDQTTNKQRALSY